MLRCFAAVAQTGNLADAGSQLGRTPSAVSMTLKQLEDHLGARLFQAERKNRLTPLGQEIYEMTQQQLLHYDETVGAIEAMSRAPKGLLRIASIPSAAHRGLPSAVDILTARHPALRIELRDTDTEAVQRALLRGQVDVGIVSGQPELNGIRAEPLFTDAFGLVAASDHPLIHRDKPLRLNDFRSEEFLGNDLCAQIQSPAFDELMRPAQVTVRNTLSLLSMVRSGPWITVLPASVISILPGRLAFRLIEDLDVERSVSLLSREQSLFPELVDEFSEILRQHDWSNTDMQD